MDPMRWARIWELFHEARDIEPARLPPFLDAVCDGDAELRRELESLLAADARDGTPLDLPRVAAVESEEDEAGRDVGAYRLLRAIGRGGMGAVYLAARRDDSFRKLVAVKLIKRGMDTDEIVLRFRKERQILADLEHPNIARLLDGGNTPDGLPYFVMEYVEGQTIDRYCDERRLDVRDRLQLFQVVCGAIDYAHRSLVIHRDLKPSNVLVTRDGQPKLLDFGIAKLLQPGADSLSASPTATGVRPMTPEFASPEQLAGRSVTTASDVYSLGAMLYLLLAGRLPYTPPTRDPDLLVRLVRDAPPPRPSVVASRPTAQSSAATDPERVAHTRGAAGAQRLARQLAGDLDNIVLKALRYEADRRYGSVADFAGDIGRYLAGRPVSARKDTWAYRTRKFLLRHRAGTAAASVALLGLLGGGVFSIVGFVRAVRAERVAQEEAATAREVSDFLLDLFSVSDPSQSRGETITAREILGRGAERIRAGLADRPRVRGRLLLTIGDTYQRLGLYEQSAALLDEALQVCLESYGPDAPETSDVLHAIGVVAYREGRFERASEYVLRSIAILETARAPDARRLASQLSSLADIQRDTADLPGALRTLQRSLELYDDMEDPDAIQVAHSLTRMGSALIEMGRGDEAIVSLQRARETLERQLGPDHPDLFYSVNSIGIYHWRGGRLEEARPWFERALRLAERGYGPDHPFTGTLANNLGRLLRDLGDYDAALPLARRAVENHERSLGPDHPELANSLANLAGLLRDMGRVEEALPIYRRAIDLQRKALAADHPHRARTLDGYAVALRQLGRVADADAAAAEAAAIRATRVESAGE